jgi:hypothetical protein
VWLSEIKSKFKVCKFRLTSYLLSAVYALMKLGLHFHFSRKALYKKLHKHYKLYKHHEIERKLRTRLRHCVLVTLCSNSCDYDFYQAGFCQVINLIYIYLTGLQLRHNQGFQIISVFVERFCPHIFTRCLVLKCLSLKSPLNTSVYCWKLVWFFLFLCVRACLLALVWWIVNIR